MIYIYDGGPLSVTEEEEEKKDFYSSSIRLGWTVQDVHTKFLYFQDMISICELIKSLFVKYNFNHLIGNGSTVQQALGQYTVG